jgi:hypothetical protein
VAAQQLGRQVPVFAQLGVADRLDCMAVLGVPARGEPVELRDLGRRVPPELEPKQIPEQVVVSKPGPCHVHRDHERAGLLELVQDADAVPASRQRVGE